MLTYTVYSEAGGIGKTTLSAHLATAHAQAGRDVLVIDGDPQDGSLSYLFDVGDQRDESGADNLVRHLIDRPGGEFHDLIEAGPHGIDVVPSHNMLARLPKLLVQAEEMADEMDEKFEPEQRLLQVLGEAGIHEEYDTLIIDPQASEGPFLYNSIAATRNLVLPLELSGKGEQSVTGLGDLVDGLEEQLGIDVGVLAAVPNRAGGTNDQQHYREELSQHGYPTPVAIRERSSLFEGCWRQQCTAFEYVEKHRDRQRDYELETLEKIETLAKTIEAEVEADDAPEVEA